MQLKSFNFQQLVSNEQINSRNDYGDITQLADNIRTNGLIKPLEGFEGPEGTFHIRDGFRRFRALQELSSQGYEFPIQCLVKPESEFSESDSLYLQINGNSGKSLTPLELGKVLQDLELAGQTIPEICKRCTFSEGYIRDILALSYAPGIIQEMITAGNVSSSVVINAMKQTDNESELVELINSAKDKETGKISPAKVKKTIQDNKQITGNRSGTNVPVKSPAKGLEQAERVLMELHAQTGLDSMLWIWEAIQGNMPVSSIVLNVKSEISN
jgi:ParB-like chromosome segregation protein Spo0J